MLVVYIIVFLKYILPFGMFLFPFQVSFANFILDSVDGDILMHWGLPFVLYAPIDKTADYLTYFVMLLVGRKWKIKKTILALFLYRSVGQILYFATGHDKYLFYFPNFLEPLFILFSALVFVDRKMAYERYKKYILSIWILIILYKMWNEYNLHVGHIDLSEKYFGINN